MTEVKLSFAMTNLKKWRRGGGSFIMTKVKMPKDPLPSLHLVMLQCNLVSFAHFSSPSEHKKPHHFRPMHHRDCLLAETNHLDEENQCDKNTFQSKAVFFTHIPHRAQQYLQ